MEGPGDGAAVADVMMWAFPKDPTEETRGAGFSGQRSQDVPEQTLL